MLLYHSLAIALSSLTLSTAQESLFAAQAEAAQSLPATIKWPTNLVGTWSTKSLSTLTGPVCQARPQPSPLHTDCHRASSTP